MLIPSSDYINAEIKSYAGFKKSIKNIFTFIDLFVNNRYHEKIF